MLDSANESVVFRRDTRALRAAKMLCETVFANVVQRLPQSTLQRTRRTWHGIAYAIAGDVERLASLLFLGFARVKFEPHAAKNIRHLRERGKLGIARESQVVGVACECRSRPDRKRRELSIGIEQYDVREEWASGIAERKRTIPRHDSRQDVRAGKL